MTGYLLLAFLLVLNFACGAMAATTYAEWRAQKRLRVLLHNTIELGGSCNELLGIHNSMWALGGRRTPDSIVILADAELRPVTRATEGE